VHAGRGIACRTVTAFPVETTKKVPDTYFGVWRARRIGRVVRAKPVRSGTAYVSKTVCPDRRERRALFDVTRGKQKNKNRQARDAQTCSKTRVREHAAGRQILRTIATYNARDSSQGSRNSKCKPPLLIERTVCTRVVRRVMYVRIYVRVYTTAAVE